MLQVQISLNVEVPPCVWDLVEAAWWGNHLCHVIPKTAAQRHLCAAVTKYGRVKIFP